MLQDQDQELDSLAVVDFLYQILFLVPYQTTKYGWMRPWRFDLVVVACLQLCSKHFYYLESWVKEIQAFQAVVKAEDSRLQLVRSKISKDYLKYLATVWLDARMICVRSGSWNNRIITMGRPFDFCSCFVEKNETVATLRMTLDFIVDFPNQNPFGTHSITSPAWKPRVVINTSLISQCLSFLATVSRSKRLGLIFHCQSFHFSCYYCCCYNLP